MSIEPFAFPQVEFCDVPESVGAFEFPTATEFVIEQPAISVTVTK